MVERLMALNISACGLSDIGLVRQNNEDVWAELPELGVFVLADGMGGHQAGEVASREAVDAFCALMHKNLKGGVKPLEECAELIRTAFEKVNVHVYKMGRAHPELKGMGTTLCALHLQPEGVVFAHVGDSRIYRYREGKLQQLTKDHSLIRELVELGQVSEHQASDFVYKNIITRAIGTEPNVEPTVQSDSALEGDVYLLCTDGLSDLLPLCEIEAVLNAGLLLSETVRKLVERSKEKGGHDNVTVLLVKVSKNHENLFGQ